MESVVLSFDANKFREIEARRPRIVMGESVLATACLYCKGYGRHEDSEECFVCHGSGYTPTPDGEALLRFLRIFSALTPEQAAKLVAS